MGTIETDYGVTGATVEEPTRWPFTKGGVPSPVTDRALQPCGISRGHFVPSDSGYNPNRQLSISGTTGLPAGNGALPLTLRVYGQGEAIISQGITGAGGAFRFDGLQPGDYEVIVGGTPEHRGKTFGPITVVATP